MWIGSPWNLVLECSHGYEKELQQFIFQIGVMLAGYLAAIIKSVIIQGGVSTIISDSQQGGRLNFFE